MSRSHDVEYQAFDSSHLEGVVRLCDQLGWPSYTDRATASAAFSAPGAVTRVAMRRGEVIGLAHLLTNGVVHAHLSLVGVLPEARRRGVASRLVSEVFAAGGGKWLDLCAEQGSEHFYRSFDHEERAGFRIYPRKPAG